MVTHTHPHRAAAGGMQVLAGLLVATLLMWAGAVLTEPSSPPPTDLLLVNPSLAVREPIVQVKPPAHLIVLKPLT